MSNPNNRQSALSDEDRDSLNVASALTNTLLDLFTNEYPHTLDDARARLRIFYVLRTITERIDTVLAAQEKKSTVDTNSIEMLVALVQNAGIGKIN